MDEKGKWLPKCLREYVLDENGSLFFLQGSEVQNRFYAGSTGNLLFPAVWEEGQFRRCAQLAVFGMVIFVYLSLWYCMAGGWFRNTFFVCYRSSLADPLFYVRLFTHVLGHQNLSHYASNMTMFLLIGPMLEEKYGSVCLLEIIGIVAFVTGMVQVLLFPHNGLLGASGVVFAFMILASITGSGNGEIPLTMIIVMVIYIGQELYSGIAVSDHISQLTHIIGGMLGAAYGLMMRPEKNK